MYYHFFYTLAESFCNNSGRTSYTPLHFLERHTDPFRCMHSIRTAPTCNLNVSYNNSHLTYILSPDFHPTLHVQFLLGNITIYRDSSAFVQRTIFFYYYNLQQSLCIHSNGLCTHDLLHNDTCIIRCLF